jgi:sortase A
MSKKVSHPKAAFSFKRQVLPPVLGVLVMLGVLGLINGQWLSAQLYYKFGRPDVVDTLPVAGLQLDPNAAPEISIPQINVKAPVIFEPSYEESKVQLALRRGVVKFATTADPGQNGNVVIFGHSSGQPWAPGDYKFVFTMLEKLESGDKIYIDYKGTRYIYRMTNSQVVMPNEVQVLNSTGKPMLTLITCTPVGTSQKRLVVRAEQISPKPAATTALPAGTPVAPAPSTQVAQPETLPDGDQTSIWESIRNLF